ncbi:hypothetical protein WJX72_002739 [[Myrmecia] bisecta]|uniref:Major facilitator superfamily (MFS) profile domain-containing protein n=1 Tax=[Myrmecia] bisecta TaxID=41462 RepID=A0AAW1PVT7_9CHLO
MSRRSTLTLSKCGLDAFVSARSFRAAQQAWWQLPVEQEVCSYPVPVALHRSLLGHRGSVTGHTASGSPERSPSQGSSLAATSALGPVLPAFAKEFDVGAAAIGMTMSSFALSRLILNLPAGVMADRFGRKPLLVWGPVLTAVGMFGSGQATTFNELLAWRFVTGAGSALQMAGAQLYLTDISQPENRARVMGTNQAAALLGVSIGPAVGGLLADMAGLRAPFTATGAAALLAAVYGQFRLPETLPAALTSRHKPPPPRFC